MTQSANTTTERLQPQPPRTFLPGLVPAGQPTLVIQRNVTFQTIEGFGGAFTESSAWLYAQLNATMKKQLLSMYFGREHGIGYTLGRVPMGSCDFAVQPSVSYAMRVNDTALESFSIEPELAWKLPFILAAQAEAAAASPAASLRGTSASALGLVASPWSPPAWMKTNNQMICDLWSIVAGCSIRDDDTVHAAYAQYFVRTAQAFRAAGAPIRWFTPQNEPGVKPFTYEGSVMTAQQQADFVGKHLGPALQALPADQRPGLLAYDWNKNDAYVEFAGTVFNDTASGPFFEGSAVHWYDGDHFDSLSAVHALAPEKIILATEATAANDQAKAWEGGSWKTGHHYLHDILGDLNSHVGGFIHWNMALQEDGGPLHVGPIVGLPIYGSDAPVIVDVGGATPPPGTARTVQATPDAVGSLGDAGVISLGDRAGPGPQRIMAQASFWLIGHVSRYVVPGSKRISWSLENAPATIEASAFELPGGAGVVAVLLNSDVTPVILSVTDSVSRRVGNVTVPAMGAQTLRFV